MTLFESVTDWVAVSTDAPTCPECGGGLERDYVRAPHEQGHWRGIPALVCECGYAERDGEPEP